MIDAKQLAKVGCKYLGTPYSVMDCQKFVERCMSDLGLKNDLPGSNAWYREVMNHGWVGSPEDCKKEYGRIPDGAFLFILKQDGGEPGKYKSDGIGNASHIGIYTGMTGNEMVKQAKEDGDAIAGGYNYGDGAINSSSSRGAVCTSKFAGKSINGGWNRVGLWDRIDYFGIGGDDMGIKVTYLAKVIGGGLNMRAEPSTSATRITQIPDGELVTVTEDLSGWSKVFYDGMEGYVMSQYLQEVTNPEPVGEMVTVPKKELENIYDMIGNMLGLRG